MSTSLPVTGAPAHRALVAQGIVTLEQLSTYPEAWVASLHGVGPKAMRLLRAALADVGLGFAAPAATPATTRRAARPGVASATPSHQTGDRA